MINKLLVSFILTDWLLNIGTIIFFILKYFLTSCLSKNWFLRIKIDFFYIQLLLAQYRHF